MFENVVLDVFIGLVFVFLLYSLLLTILVDIITTKLGLHSRVLRLSIEKMLNDGYYEQQAKTWADRFLNELKLLLLYEHADFKTSFAGKFYDQPIIKYLSKNREKSLFSFKLTKPSYISADVFADAMIYLFRENSQGETDMERVRYALRFNTLTIQPQTIKLLQHLAQDADDDLTHFKGSLIRWYNETQDRAIGWFKTKQKMLLFIMGLILAFALNIDSISISKVLIHNKEKRDYLAAMGVKATDPSSPVAALVRKQEAQLTSSYQMPDSLLSVGNVLGFGPDGYATAKTCLGFSWYKQLNPFRYQFWGILFTAFAFSLGAPFWFDLLQKLVAIRGTGKKPDAKAEAEKAVNPPAGAGPQGRALDLSLSPTVIALTTTLDEIKILAAPLKGIIRIKKGSKFYNGVETKTVEVHGTHEAITELKKLAGDTKNGVTINYLDNCPPTAQSLSLGDGLKNRRGKESGTLGCFFKDSTATGNDVFLGSCWHVLKADTDWKTKPTPETADILDDQDDIVATLVEGNITDTFDIGFAKLKNPDDRKVVKNYLKSDKPRIVNSVEEEVPKTQVHYQGLKTSNTAFIDEVTTPPLDFNFPGGTITLRDLFTITIYDDSGNLKAPSVRGDSGALVVDADGIPLGIIVACDKYFTYVAKYSNIMADADYSKYRFIIK